MIPVILIVAYFFKNILDNRKINLRKYSLTLNLKFIGYFLLGFYLTASVYSLMSSHFSNTYPFDFDFFTAHNERKIVNFLLNKENVLQSNRIYTDVWTKNFLSFLLKNHPEFTVGDYNKPVNEMRDSYIILNRPRISFLLKYKDDQPSDFVSSPPDSWIFIKEFKRKSTGDSAAIYFVPEHN
jgi:hypothetical protein